MNDIRIISERVNVGIEQELPNNIIASSKLNISLNESNAEYNILTEKIDSKISETVLDYNLIEDVTNVNLQNGISIHGDLSGLGADDHLQYYNETRINTWLSEKTTDDITEGSTNLYDKTVTITAGTNIDSVTGTYPNFTINASTQDNGVSSLNSLTGNINLVAGTNIDSIDASGDEITINAANQEAVTLDTRSNILASSPDNGTLAYATDTKQYYIYNTKWFAISNIIGVPNERTSSQINAGVLQSSSETSGYSSKYIANKTISNSYVGSFDEVNKVVKNGAVRYNSLTNQFQIYIDEWKNVRTLSPSEVANITVYSALKVKDGKGRFMVQHGFVNAGALASDYLIDGGTF